MVRKEEEVKEETEQVMISRVERREREEEISNLCTHVAMRGKA